MIIIATAHRQAQPRFMLSFSSHRPNNNAIMSNTVLPSHIPQPQTHSPYFPHGCGCQSLFSAAAMTRSLYFPYGCDENNPDWDVFVVITDKLYFPYGCDGR